MSIGSTHLPQLLLEGTLLGPPCCFLFGRWQSGIRTDRGDCPIIDVLDLFAPSEQVFVGRMALLQVMNITQEVNPTSLMQPQMGIVACVKVRTEYPLVVFSHQLKHNLARSGLVILVVADGGGIHTPD